jgi:hypothetical protein
MTRKVIFGFATLVICLSIGTTALADPWKDESGHGKGRGHYGWRGHGEPPDWARGKGVWDGHYKHGRPDRRWDHGYRGGHEYWGRGFRSYGGYPHQRGYSKSYRIPYRYPQPAPYFYYSPYPYGRGWCF